MSRLTRHGTAEPVSRDQILMHERGQGKHIFSCSADHVQDWQPYIAILIEYASTGYGCQSCSWSAERGKILFFLSPFAPENYVSRDRFGRPLAGFLPLSATACTHVPSTAIGSVPSLAGHANAYRWRSLPRVRPHRASSRQGSSSEGCCLLKFHHAPIYTPLFCHTH